MQHRNFGIMWYIYSPKASDFFMVINGVTYWFITAKCPHIYRVLLSLGFFPECVARVPVSLWGLGVEGLFARRCVHGRNRPQPSAIVRNRSQPFVRSPYGRAYGKFCRRCHFWRFPTFRCFVSRGRRGTLWHSDVFCNMSKVVLCVAGAILLRRFPKMRGSFRGRCSTLDVSIVILRGRRSTLDVSCSVFFANRIGRAASSGDKVQIPWQAWHFVTCAENWRKPRTKHRFWGCKI